MKELLIKTLEGLNYPIKQQGSMMPEEPYPDHFFTFWNNSADGNSYYSNTEGAIIWNFSLNFYSINPLLVTSTLLTAKVLLQEAGFIVTGAGYDVMSDEPTHTGRGIIALYRQEQ